MTFALVHSWWWGALCAVHRSYGPAPFARWVRVSAEEYADLEAAGFRVCRSWAGPKEED